MKYLNAVETNRGYYMLLAEQNYELKLAEYCAKCDACDTGAEEAREKRDADALLYYLAANHPSLHKISTDRAELQAKRAK